jgi:hypothetical protein
MKMSDKLGREVLEKLWKSIGASRTTQYRIDTGLRFKAMRILFLKIWEITALTPNEILEIPPKGHPHDKKRN